MQPRSRPSPCRARFKGALKWKSLNVEECGHEVRNEFHWSQKSRGAQAIIIATRDRISNVAVTYEPSVSAAESDAIPRLVVVQLLCGSTITRSVRDEAARRRKKSVRLRKV